MAKESDDDFCSPKPSRSLLAAPRRPEKKGDVQSIPVISLQSSSICLESCEIKADSISQSGKFETCAVCLKNISHLDNLRKSAHVNKCLDTQESSSKYAKAKEKWNSVIDCPMCGEPQPPGPHRSAHAKRCGSTYNIAPKELLKLMETQNRVCNAKKQHNMLHTKAPLPVKKEVLPAKLKGAPNSFLEENLQLAKALSASMVTNPKEENCDTSPQFTRVLDPHDNKRKRPRSFAVVELAPRTCKCEVLQKIHDRFLEAFRLRKTDGAIVSHTEIRNNFAIRTTAFMQQQTQLLEKLERLERLSHDMYLLMGEESSADVRIQCIDGTLNAHRCVLHTRTLLICKTSQTACQNVEINESEKIVRHWLSYVYSGRVEWETEDTERIKQIAEQYGPDDLLPFCARMLTLSHLKAATVSTSSTQSLPIPNLCDGDKGISLSATEPINQPTSASQSNTNQHSLPNIIIPNELTVKLMSSSAKDKSLDNAVDYEDPLQGISLADTTEEREANDEFVILDDSDGCSRGTAEQVNAVESCSNKLHGDVIDLTTPERVLTAKPVIDDLEITLVDLSATSDRSGTPSSSKSPDIFEEKSKDCSTAVSVSKPICVTPLRISSTQRRDLSSLRLSLNNRLSSSSLHNGIILLGEERKQFDVRSIVNESSKALPEQPIENHSENARIDVYDAEVVCLDEKTEQNRNSTSTDPYENEYFDYYDSFVEQWHEPVDEFAPHEVNCDVIAPQQSPKESAEKCDVKTPKRSSAENSKQSFISSSLEQYEPVDNIDRFPVGVSSQDSFFDTPKFINNPRLNFANPSSFAENSAAIDVVSPAAHSTPLQPARKKARFGSNVKVLKTTNITPMPDYESMNDECLKNELRKFGLKPFGRRRSIAILKKIYAETHPEIDPSTPTIRPLIVTDAGDDTELAPNSKSAILRTRGQAIKTFPEAMKGAKLPSTPSKNGQVETVEDNEDEDLVDFGDKTLNDPSDEPPEESMIDDGLPPKDLEGMTRTFLIWLRNPENDELYNHLLSLQPVLLDELHLRMSRSDTAVCCIPKKALANILDHLGVTFSLSQVNGGRRFVHLKKGCF